VVANVKKNSSARQQDFKNRLYDAADSRWDRIIKIVLDRAEDDTEKSHFYIKLLWEYVMGKPSQAIEINKEDYPELILNLETQELREKALDIFAKAETDLVEAKIIKEVNN
jgi:hypothetical protein